MKLGEIPSKEEMKIREALTPEMLSGYSKDQRIKMIKEASKLLQGQLDEVKQKITNYMKVIPQMKAQEIDIKPQI